MHAYIAKALPWVGPEVACLPFLQELRAEINKQLLQAENQIESAYVSAKATAESKWAQMHGEL